MNGCPGLKTGASGRPGIAFRNVVIVGCGTPSVPPGTKQVRIALVETRTFGSLLYRAGLDIWSSWSGLSSA